MFSSSELQVLTVLAEGGTMLASSIARKSGLKRPTVYAILHKLKAEGLLITLTKKELRYFKLLDLSLMKEALQLEAKSKYRSSLHSIESFVALLKDKQKEEHQLFSGFEVSTVDKAETVYMEVTDAFTRSEWIKAIFNPQLVMTDADSRKVVTSFLEVSAEKGTRIQEIAMEGPVTDWYEKQIQNPHHELKRVNSASPILTDFIVSEQALYLLRYDNSEGAGLKIQRGDLVTTFSSIFDLLWERL